MLQKELAKRLKARYDTKMDGNGWLEVSSDAEVDIGPAAPPDDWFVFMNSLQSAAQCSSGVDRWNSNGKGLKRLL